TSSLLARVMIISIVPSPGETEARSKRSKSISNRKSAESKTSSNSVSSIQDKSLESHSACSTARFASSLIGSECATDSRSKSEASSALTECLNASLSRTAKRWKNALTQNNRGNRMKWRTKKRCQTRMYSGKEKNKSDKTSVCERR